MRLNFFKIGCLTICLAFLFSVKMLAQQQVKSFTSDPVKFSKEMQDFLEETNKKEAEKLMQSFNALWTVGKFTSAQQDAIYGMSNLMLKKRLKAFPDFQNYLLTLIGFAESGLPEQNFINWNSSLEKLVSSKARKISDYLEVCSGLFAKNILYESNTVKWTASANNFTFEFDTLPKVLFKNIDLTCEAKKDTLIIYATQGVYYPTLKQFFGTSARVNWENAGIPSSDAFADLGGFVIDLSGSDFTCDSATLTYKKYFKYPLKGKFSDKLVVNANPETVNYPRFDSYNQDLEIKELIKDADYKGGFSIKGNKMVGSGNELEDAHLTFKRAGKKFLVAASKNFVVKSDRVVSSEAAVTIYFDKDSMYHPGLEFKYLYKDKEVSLIRNAESGNASPFFDSYHAVDMYFDGLTWKTDDPVIDLKILTAAGEHKLSFESASFFRQERIFQLQGISSQNPLYTVKQYAEKNQITEIFTQEFARSIKQSDEQARRLLITLSNQGFLSFDYANDKAVIKDKLYFYLNSLTNKTDFDVISFESVISGKPNASINLLNYDITMRGVAKINLSDTQRVYVIPNEQEITLKKNRDFTFAGRVHAGRTDFYGKNFSFDYKNFKFILDNVDSIRLKILSDTANANGEFPLIPLKSVLQNVTGELLIDRDDNKSSRKKASTYPVFKSNKDSYIYYDYPDIYDAVYSRDKFYFHLEPFTIDSLDNFSSNGLAFKGDFISADIFPLLKDSLTIQPDFSLGFQRSTPSSGLTAYKGKGKFYQDFSLSHQGLEGNGQIDFLSSVTKSSHIVFFPDSANADAYEFEIKKQTIALAAFPEVKATDVYINWRPYQDKMYIYKKTKNFDLYDKQATLDGSLVLSSKGLNANGLIAFGQSELESNNFALNQTKFGADTSDFRINSDNKDILAFTTKNVKSEVDLEKRTAEFKSNGGGSYVSFPINQYICYIDQFKWFMDKKLIELGAIADKGSTKFNIKASEFVSVHPQQDSLRFTAPYAGYSLTDYIIKASQVKEILVADASIQPDSGNVIVEKDALMKTFKQAKVVANTTSKYHTMLHAEISVTGRKSYSGSGDYDYLDQAGVKHLVNLTRIAVDTSLQTYANGEIPDTSNFTISPNTQYKGKVGLVASDPLLFFSGFARVNHQCEVLEKNWFSFSSVIDPSGVTIPINDPLNENKERLSVAVFFAGDSTNIYSSFLSPKKKTSDMEIISADGVLSYDNKTQLYQVTNKTKLLNREMPGNYVSLDDRNCTVFGEGRINLGTNFGQFKLNAEGNVTNNMTIDSAEFQLMLDMDFMFNEEALKMMSDLILSYPTLPATIDSRPVFVRGMTNILGKEKYDKFNAEVNLYGSPKKLPDELQHGIFLSDVHLFWNKGTLSYRSKGQIGIGYIKKVAVNRLLNGYLEIIRKRNGDVLNMYVELDPYTWYFFNYQRGVMQVISSDSKFNDLINNMKPEKRVADEKNNAAPYQYMVSTERKKNEFLRKVKGSEE